MKKVSKEMVVDTALDGDKTYKPEKDEYIETTPFYKKRKRERLVALRAKLKIDDNDTFENYLRSNK